MQKSNTYYLKNFIEKHNIHSLDKQRCNVCFQTERNQRKNQNDQQYELFCQVCHTNVHYLCYISQKIIPMTPWKCYRCLCQQSAFKGQKKQISCKFCPHKWGALTKFTISRITIWAHNACIKFNPNLCITQNKNVRSRSQTLHEITIIDQESYNKQIFQICYYCRNKVGYAIKCENLGCKKHFHFMCWIICSNFAKQFNTINEASDIFKLYCDDHIESQVFRRKSLIYYRQEEQNSQVTIKDQQENNL